MTRAPANFKEDWVARFRDISILVFWSDFAYGWGYPPKNRFSVDSARADAAIASKLSREPGNDLAGLPLNFGAWGCRG